MSIIGNQKYKLKTLRKYISHVHQLDMNIGNVLGHANPFRPSSLCIDTCEFFIKIKCQFYYSTMGSFHSTAFTFLF